MIKLNEQWKTNTDKYKCPFCDKEFSKMGISTHIWRMHDEGKNHNPNLGYLPGTRQAWNKGLTKESDYRIKKIGESLSEKIKTGEIIPYWRGKHLSQKTRDLLSKVSGGYRINSGHGKSGWYKNIYCGSSYELAWVIYNLEHNIKFERNMTGFDYMFEDRNHKYYPDFKINDVYIEIKGFKRNNDDAKWKYFPHELKILFKSDLKEMLDYVINKYGNSFTDLYEINYKKKKQSHI